MNRPPPAPACAELASTGYREVEDYVDNARAEMRQELQRLEREP